MSRFVKQFILEIFLLLAVLATGVLIKNNANTLYCLLPAICSYVFAF